MVSFIIGIGIVLVTFYLAFLYASPAIGLLAFAQALLLALAFVFLLWYRRRMDAVIRIPIAVSERGGQATVQLVVRNDSRIPCMRIRYRLCLGSSLSHRKRRVWQRGAAVCAGENVCQAAVNAPYAGNYIVELERLRIWDPTGLFYMDRRVRRSASFQVLPEVACVSVRVTERTRNFFGDADVYDDFRPGGDRSEIFDVREFRPGDRIQSIHWKLSAKTDEWIVREDSSPLACPVVLLLEGSRQKRLQEAEGYLSVAASIVFSLMDAHCPHYVSWYSRSRQDIVRARVDDEEGYYLFLSSYLEDFCAAPAEELQRLYREKYRYERPLHTLQLRANLTLWQEGRQVGAVSAADWESGVEGLELIL